MRLTRPRPIPLLAAALLAGAAALACTGCEVSIPEGRFGCDRDQDCPPEQVCRTNVGRCYLTPSPGEAADGGAGDGG